ncbi:MAG TPA: hypothetical protein VEW03_08840 [Longimicrobiaceae bacterium]|nr:hypothetical protein [Longimicrobiaceae bacterium]
MTALLGVTISIPALLARLDGTERWMLDWFGLSAALLLVAATGLRRQPAVEPDTPETESTGKEKIPGAYRVAVWIARIGAGLFASVILLQTVVATVEQRWDALAAPLVLLALAALLAAVRGVDLLLDEGEEMRGSARRPMRAGD